MMFNIFNIKSYYLSKKNSKGRTARNVTEPIYDLKCLKILRIQDFEGYGRKDLSWG